MSLRFDYIAQPRPGVERDRLDVTFLLFMGLVGLLAIAVGVATGWDALAEDGRNPLDPDTIWRELVADSTPGGEERRWLDELAVLELPRRHRIC